MNLYRLYVEHFNLPALSNGEYHDILTGHLSEMEPLYGVGLSLYYLHQTKETDIHLRGLRCEIAVMSKMVSPTHGHVDLIRHSEHVMLCTSLEKLLG